MLNLFFGVRFGTSTPDKRTVEHIKKKSNDKSETVYYLIKNGSFSGIKHLKRK